MSPAHLLSGLGRLSAQAAVVVVVILVVQAAFRKWLTPRWRCALWLLLVARLLLPVSFESTASIFNVVSLSRVERVAPNTLLGRSMGFQPMSSTDTGWKPVPLQTSALGTTRSTIHDTIPAAGEPALGQPLSLPAPAVRRDWWHSGAFWGALWLAGFCAFLLNVAFRSVRWIRRFSDSPQVTDPGVLELVRECAGRLGLRTPPAIYESRAVSSPVLYGVFRPRLVLPRGFVGRFSREEISFVVLHEMVHLKRGDLILNWLIAGLQAIHWFNPLVWLGFARWRADRELACDAAVLEAVGDGRNRNYGETIIQLLEGCARQAAIPGHVGVLEAPFDLRMRLAMIMDFKPASRWSASAFLLLAAVGIGCLTNARFGSMPALPAVISSAKNTVLSALPVPSARIASTQVISPAVNSPARVVPGVSTGQAGQKPAAVALAKPVAKLLPRVRLPVPVPASVAQEMASARGGSVGGRVLIADRAVTAKVTAGAADRGGHALPQRPQVQVDEDVSVLTHEISVRVVGALTPEGRSFERPSPARPVYYIPVATGYQEVGRVLGGPTHPQPAADVERATIKALAGEGYLVATRKSPPSLILTFGWGYEAPGLMMDQVSEPGEVYINLMDSPKALQEYDVHVQHFLSIQAFDYQAWRRREVVPLWSAHITSPKYNSRDELLPVMVAAAAPYLGRATEEPVVITAPRKGTVVVGAPIARRAKP